MRSELFRKLSPNDAKFLEAPISVDKIKNVVWSYGSEKAPGPDGFTLKFFKKYWEIIKGDVLGAVKHFERWGKISRGCNASFISFSTKIKDPLRLDDYRPISLIGSMYKIITKNLTLRIKKVIGSVIGEVQSALVEGRNILEGPLIVNEMWSCAKSNGRKILLFKADFNKAFNLVNWGFLNSTMA